MSSATSGSVARRSSHPWKPLASAAMPTAADSVTSRIAPQWASARPLMEPVRSRPWPAGSSTNMNGTRNAGIVYFQAWSVVRYGSPPVIAAAAKGESAVGGDTSESTA